MVATMAESGSTGEQLEFFILNSQKIPILPVEEPIWSLITDPTNAEDSPPIIANVDDDTSKAQRKQGTSTTNWPPTGWKTAPDFNYAQANHHLTRPSYTPLTEELAVPDDISEKYAVAATVNNPNSELLSYQTHYDDSQFWKTGRVGEEIAYNFFVGKFGVDNVKWVNEGSETGLPYDLIVIIGDERRKEYVEVKATRSATKEWFEITAREWQFAVEMGDSYSVARVMLGAQRASVTVLKNPLLLCQQNVLRLALLMLRQVEDTDVAQ